jgi:hypothetical protein
MSRSGSDSEYSDGENISVKRSYLQQLVEQFEKLSIDNQQFAQFIKEQDEELETFREKSTDIHRLRTNLEALNEENKELKLQNAELEEILEKQRTKFIYPTKVVVKRDEQEEERDKKLEQELAATKAQLAQTRKESISLRKANAELALETQELTTLLSNKDNRATSSKSTQTVMDMAQPSSPRSPASATMDEEVPKLQREILINRLEIKRLNEELSQAKQNYEAVRKANPWDRPPESIRQKPEQKSPTDLEQQLQAKNREFHATIQEMQSQLEQQKKHYAAVINELHINNKKEIKLLKHQIFKLQHEVELANKLALEKATEAKLSEQDTPEEKTPVSNTTDTTPSTLPDITTRKHKKRRNKVQTNAEAPTSRSILSYLTSMFTGAENPESTPRQRQNRPTGQKLRLGDSTAVK